MDDTKVKKAKEIIEKIRYITVATCDKDGQPWNSPVSGWYDEAYNFYWVSWTEDIHSKNIRENQRVFLVIYDSKAPEGEGQGVYIRGKAHELNSPEEIEHAIKFRRAGKSPRTPKDYMEPLPRRVYKVIPEQVWINGDGDVDGNFVDVRTEIKL